MGPSGEGWPLPDARPYALIIVGFATITLSISVVRAEETSAQSSYPRKSENAIPPGDTSEYLSVVLALRVKDYGAEDGEHCHGCRNDGKATDTFHGCACFYLLFLLLLRHRFRHKFRHGVFSSQIKFAKPDQRAS